MFKATSLILSDEQNAITCTFIHLSLDSTASRSCWYVTTTFNHSNWHPTHYYIQLAITM